MGLSSPTNAQATRFSYLALTGYFIGDSSLDEELTFTFDQTVSQVRIRVNALSFVAAGKEQMTLEVNGAPHNFISANLVTSNVQISGGWACTYS